MKIHHRFGSTFLLLPLLSLSHSAYSLPSDVYAEQWQLSTSPFSCQLINTVSGYGEVLIEAEAGSIERIQLMPDPFKQYSRTIKVELNQPPWLHTGHSLLMLKKPFSSSTPFDAPVNASFLVEQFQKGFQLQLTIERQHLPPTVIKVPALQFGDIASDFFLCFNELLAMNYEQAKENTLYFTVAKDRLNNQNIQKVTDIADYILADTTISAVEIDAHTDSLGNELDNRKLSEKRAQNTAQILIENGIPEEMITQRHHGERYPIARNSTPEGRHQNRRVKITLFRR